MNNRKIKFRALRKDNGEWAEGNLNVEYDKSTFISAWFSNIVEPENNYWEMVCKTHEVDPKTVGQYTEMKDKKGGEIYEGDIVSFQGQNLSVCFGPYIEAWDGECPKNGHNAIGWYMVDEEERYIKSLLTSWALPKMLQIEIIGNIFENPELLTTKPYNMKSLGMYTAKRLDNGEMITGELFVAYGFPQTKIISFDFHTNLSQGIPVHPFNHLKPLNLK